MHCIFDHCKVAGDYLSSIYSNCIDHCKVAGDYNGNSNSCLLILFTVTVLKFGHMSSNLLAYGAADGSLTVCSVSDPPTVTKQLIGHSKDVTG